MPRTRHTPEQIIGKLRAMEIHINSFKNWMLRASDPGRYGHFADLEPSSILPHVATHYVNQAGQSELLAFIIKDSKLLYAPDL